MTPRWPMQLGAIALVALLILAFRMLVTEVTTDPVVADAPLPETVARDPNAATTAREAATPQAMPSAPTEAEITDSPGELPASAWTRITWLQGRHAMPDFLEVFLDNLPSARSGDADAMLNLAFAIENCHMAASFRSRADLDAFAISRPLAAAEDLEAMAALIPDCRRIADEVPEGLRIQQWSAEWLQRAAAAGNALARYLLLNQWERSDAVYAEAGQALAEAVATGNSWALREAAEFVSNHPPPARDDPYQVEASAWLVLACRDDPACDASVLDQQIRWAQLPAYAEQIMLRATVIRRQLDAGEPFDFDTGWRAP